MPMRVIAGIYRHRKLIYPEDDKGIRPTKDRVREALFSILGDLYNKSFLDLYAGCGSIGIEAISRGAKFSTFVDNNEKSVSFVRKNIVSLGIEGQTEIIKGEDLFALNTFKNQGRYFDIIYLDPPYESDLYNSSLEYIFNNDLVINGGIVAIEANKEITINPLWNVKIKEYHYGEIKLIVLRKI